MRADEVRQRIFISAGSPLVFFGKPAIFVREDYAMSHRNPRERFDYKSWFERNVAKRTVAALEARDAEFAEKHADTPLAHLAQYVGNRAELLRHTPSPCEIDGGTFIEERFGGWAAVLEMAHLRPPIKEPTGRQ